MRLPHRNPPLPAPYVPTQEELQRLAESLQQERAQSLFGQAARQLVNYFQVQQGLGESSIDPQGNYEIRYDADQFQRAEKGTADLRVAVCGPGGRELVSSDILFNAGPETTIDLTAGPESEWGSK